MNRFKTIPLIFIIFSSLSYSQRKESSIASESDFLETRNFNANNIILNRVTNRGDFNTTTWGALNYGNP
jgi:hypothetical protein